MKYKAYLVEDEPKASTRINTLIYSGIFNSTTGINQSNVFNVGEDITRSLDPAKGTIQKLYAEDYYLNIFQEDKISRAPINKNIIYSAEGNPTVTTSNLVIGEPQAYKGDFTEYKRKTLNILRSLNNTQTKKIIYAASASCYGKTRNFPISENNKIFSIFSIR